MTVLEYPFELIVPFKVAVVAEAEVAELVVAKGGPSVKNVASDV